MRRLVAPALFIAHSVEVTMLSIPPHREVPAWVVCLTAANSILLRTVSTPLASIALAGSRRASRPRLSQYVGRHLSDPDERPDIALALRTTEIAQ